MAANNCTVGIAVGIRIIWIVISDSGVGIDVCANTTAVFGVNLILAEQRLLYHALLGIKDPFSALINVEPHHLPFFFSSIHSSATQEKNIQERNNKNSRIISPRSSSK